MKAISVGFYSGLGDIISALPSLREASKNSLVHVFVKDSLLEQARPFLREYVPGCIFVPFTRKLSLLPFLIKYFRKNNIAIFLVSCHPPIDHSSYFIPIFLWLVRALLFFKVSIIGEKQDHLSFFYTKKFFLDRKTRLIDREELAFVESGVLLNAPPKIFLQTSVTKDYVFFHYGASYENKLVKKEIFLSILNSISCFYPIILSAMPEDLEYFGRAALNNVTLIRGSISEIAQLLISSRAVITHDTGFAHMAGLFNKRQYAFYGPQSPRIFGPRNYNAKFYQNTSNIYDSCMPCGNKFCLRSDNNHCLSNIVVNEVVQDILQVIRDNRDLSLRN